MVTMNFRMRRNILLGAIVVLSSVIFASTAMTIFFPPRVGVPERPKGVNHPKDDVKKGGAVEPLTAYAVIYQRDLRKPLFPPKEGPAAVAEAARPALSLQLIGTAVEPGHTYGLFVDRSGQVRMGSVGDTIDGAEIKAIRDGEVTVKYFGSDVTLRVAKEGTPR